VTRRSVAQVSIYDTTTFQVNRQLTFAGLGNALNGLAACATNNYLYISDSGNKNIHRVNLALASFDSLFKWNVEHNPGALSITRAGNILVTYAHQSTVQEFTSTGSLVRTIADSGNRLGQAVELIRVGALAAIWHDKNNNYRHGVFVTKPSYIRYSPQPGVYNTDLKHSYSVLRGPRGLTLDGHGDYAIVADYGNNIQVVHPSLMASRTLPLPLEVKYPNSIVMDQSRGRLYVGEDGGENRLLAFDNVTNLGALFNN